MTRQKDSPGVSQCTEESGNTKWIVAYPGENDRGGARLVNRDTQKRNGICWEDKAAEGCWVRKFAVLV